MAIVHSILVYRLYYYTDTPFTFFQALRLIGSRSESLFSIKNILIHDLMSKVKKYQMIRWSSSLFITDMNMYNVANAMFTTYQDARRVRLVDGLIFETNILPVYIIYSIQGGPKVSTHTLALI